MTDTMHTMQDPTTEQASNDQPIIVDYWGTDETHKHYLPDETQYFEFKIMNEGDKVKFQKLTNQDLIVGRDNTAKVKVSPETERHTLIETSVIGWHLFKGGQPVGYSPQVLKMWLQSAPPKIVEELEFAIRMANPWMQADMKVEEIDKEIDRLIEMKKQRIEAEAGEGASKSK